MMTFNCNDPNFLTIFTYFAIIALTLFAGGLACFKLCRPFMMRWRQKKSDTTLSPTTGEDTAG